MRAEELGGTPGSVQGEAGSRGAGGRVGLRGRSLFGFGFFGTCRLFRPNANRPHTYIYNTHYRLPPPAPEVPLII